MNRPLFGVFISPHAGNIPRLRSRVRTAEDSGFDYISVQDHPYVPEFLDTMTLLGSLIAETSRIRFMTNVANLPLRPPAMLAKAAATLDLLSGGRFELGLGGGRVWPQIVGLGGQALAPGEVYRSVDEAITILRAMWMEGRSTHFAGTQYRIAAATGPAPAHDIGIWLGAAGPRMLDLVGRRADGWIAPISTPFETKLDAQNRIDVGARSADRKPEDVRRVIQLVGSVTGTPGTTDRPRSGPGNRPIRTTPQYWAEIIAGFVAEERFDTINFLPEDDSPAQLRRFAEEVIPAARRLAESAV